MQAAWAVLHFSISVQLELVGHTLAEANVTSNDDSFSSLEGRIGIIDPDIVELSNLQRQTLHSEATLGTPKVFSAAQYLTKCVINLLVFV